jgi:flavin reductase (DIM6/NTAB) family NADH-FMN oxidoreductase RutF
MELEASTLDALAAHKIMMGSIVPRPVAWISTKSKRGIVNVAPYSAYTLVSQDPPLVLFQSAKNHSEKNSAKNIRETKEFVINSVDHSLLKKMHQSSADLPEDVSEAEEFDIELYDSLTVSPPRIRGSPVCFECKLHSMFDIGNDPHTIIIGEIIHFFVDDRVYKNGGIDQQELRAVARIGGPTYAHLGELIHMPAATRLKTS